MIQNYSEHATFPVAANIESTLKSIVEDLERLIGVTEEKYAYIYECLPECERQLKFSAREVEILLDYLIFNGRPGSSSIIQDTLAKIQEEFEEVTSTFLNLVSMLFTTFVNKSGEDRQSFSEMTRVVRDVEETLAMLRDIALNSIIFSIKAGEGGAAFQILADRINHVSGELGIQFGAMKKIVDQLYEWNENFQRALRDVISYEDNLKSKYHDKFQGEFHRIIRTLDTICELLRDNLENTKAGFTGVGQIMVMIQNQDIIRQNIENIVKCIKIALERIGALSLHEQEKCLDYIVFTNRVMELSKVLMDNIEDSLNDSIKRISTTLSEMNEAVSDLEEDAHYLGKFLAGEAGQQAGDYVLGDVFNTVLNQISELTYLKSHIDSKSNLLLEEWETFIELMEKVSRDFEAINREANRLKKMKLLIKIELARLNFENDFTLKGIVGAVDQVIDIINSNQQMFIKLRDHFLKNLNEFNNAVGRTQNKLESMSATISGTRHKLEVVQRLGRDAVLASSTEMREIFNQLRQPYRYLADTSVIDSLTSSARNKIDRLYEELRELQNQLFHWFGVSQWEEKEDDLKLLLDQFTTYVERKIMTEVTRNEIQDIGGDGGDIVLF